MRFHALVVAVRTWLEAIRHVRTGGRSTIRRAQRKAKAPAPRCPTCRQEMPTSDDWHDHIHL